MRTGRIGAVPALLLSAACAFASPARNSGGRDVWEGWSFLLGEWIGNGAGSPGEGTGTFSFRPELDGRIFVRKSRVEYPSRDGIAAPLIHEDILVIYPVPGGAGFRAIYFDNEGHRIPYRAALYPKGPSVVFESEGAEGGARFRLVYEGAASGDVSIAFSIAAPGEDFRVYVNGTARRK